MASIVGWVDYDQGDADRARQLISLFSTPEARDELGLGAIRDAFSDLLFPGTSTIQTRLRYFIFLPRIMSEIERRLARAADREAILRKREADLIGQFADAADRLGLIGAEAGPAIKRMPSAVYWHGLGAWGIRLNQSQGIALTLDRMAAGDPCWLEVPVEGEMDTFMLTPAERGFLAELAGTLRVGDHLPPLGWLFINAAAVVKAAGGRAALARAQLSDLPAALRRCGAPPSVFDDLACAVSFSQVMHGASLLYNRMLAEHAKDEGLAGEYAGRAEEWRRSLPARQIDPATLLEPLGKVMGPRAFNPATIDFVGKWFEFAWSDHQGVGARSLVTDRERRAKGSRARLAKPPGSEWLGASGADRLAFRWPTVRQYLLDLTGPGGR